MPDLLLEQFLPYRLSRAAAQVSEAFRAVYGADHDLTVPEWRVLATLGQFPELGAKAIGAHSSMHKTKVCRAVRGLELRRWLRRREHDRDRREQILALTPAGRAAYRDIVPLALAFEARLIAVFGPDASAMIDALTRLESAAIDSLHR